MNKRQIKKRYKRINGTNPPKSFTMYQIKRCSTNNICKNRIHISVFLVKNAATVIAKQFIIWAEAIVALKSKIEEVNHEQETEKETAKKASEI